MRLDKIDLKIIELLSKDPEICQEEIAREVGITQPAVCLRLKKLKKLGILKKVCGMDVKTLNLKALGVVGKAEREMVEQHPYVLSFFDLGDKIFAVFVGEDYETCESCAKAIFEEIEGMWKIAQLSDLVLQIRRGKCAKPCDECEYYKECEGLAWSKWYKGKVFKPLAFL